MCFFLLSLDKKEHLILLITCPCSEFTSIYWINVSAAKVWARFLYSSNYSVKPWRLIYSFQSLMTNFMFGFSFSQGKWETNWVSKRQSNVFSMTLRNVSMRQRIYVYQRWPAAKSKTSRSSIINMIVAAFFKCPSVGTSSPHYSFTQNLADNWSDIVADFAGQLSNLIKLTDQCLIREQ